MPGPLVDINLHTTTHAPGIWDYLPFVADLMPYGIDPDQAGFGVGFT